MKTIFDAIVSIFFTREKFCKSRKLEEVTRDWRQLELVWNVIENSRESLAEAPEGFGYGLAAQQSAAIKIDRNPAAPATPFSSPNETVFFDTLQHHFYKAA